MDQGRSIGNDDTNVMDRGHFVLFLSKNFSFKCHRDEAKNIFSVNALSFHPTYGTFSTAGADGTVSFWDKDSKQRLKAFSNVNGTIPCTAFNRTGNIFAYAVSYDWSKVRKLYLSPYILSLYINSTFIGIQICQSIKSSQDLFTCRP
jgi:WD40 repeat protein